MEIRDTGKVSKANLLKGNANEDFFNSLKLQCKEDSGTWRESHRRSSIIHFKI